MLREHEEMSPMYKAELIKGELVISEVTAHIYMRIGTSGLGYSKAEAIEILRRQILDKFADDLKRINWQAIPYMRN